MIETQFDILVDVIIAGQNVSSVWSSILKEVNIDDGSDNEADSADMVLSDRDGRIYIPQSRDPVQVYLGRPSTGLGQVFEGFVDEPRSRMSLRGGREIVVHCKSVDLKGPAKEAKEEFWDDQNLKTILQGAFQDTGIDVKVDPMFAKIIREYEAMDGRDPLSFAADLAREVGATFKCMGPRAVFVQRNTGINVVGMPMPTVLAIAGKNLLPDWDIAPTRTRPVFNDAVNRWFDFAKNKWMKESEKMTKGQVPYVRTVQRATQSLAKEEAGGGKVESERDAGVGHCTIKGDYQAQAGGTLILAGARSFVDGEYIIGNAQHAVTLPESWITTCELKRPSGSAGTDSRG